jgi:hypothetical protein
VLEALDNFWHQHFPETWPIAYELKRVYPDRWVRFHSLPKSKRYAETPEEQAIILERHNTVIDNLNISRSNLYLITSQWGDSATPDNDRDELNILDPNAIGWKSLPLHELRKDDYQVFLHLSVSKWEWLTGIFDSILPLVADDKIANVMIVNVVEQWVYHPYDGGADVILKSTIERDKVKQKYFAWLSSHPLGY